MLTPFRLLDVDADAELHSAIQLNKPEGYHTGSRCWNWAPELSLRSSRLFKERSSGPGVIQAH
jgi:hypothetical protein